MRISTFIRELQLKQSQYGNLEVKFVNVGPKKIYDFMDFNPGMDENGSRLIFMGGATLENEYENVLGQS